MRPTTAPVKFVVQYYVLKLRKLRTESIMGTRNRSYLNCALVNIQSVGNKTHEIRDYINDNKMDVLMLTETWLNYSDSAKIREMTPDTHRFLHVPRGTGRGGRCGDLCF